MIFAKRESISAFLGKVLIQCYACIALVGVQGRSALRRVLDSLRNKVSLRPYSPCSIAMVQASTTSVAIGR